MEKPVQYVIRNYQKGDETEIAKILSECFEPTTARAYMRWKGRVRRRPGELFLATVNTRPISHVEVSTKQLHLGEGVFSTSACVGGVCTDSDYRKKGIVTHLLKLSLDVTRQDGVSNAALFTGLDLPARRIYQRLGFVEIMTWRNYMRYIDYPYIFDKWVLRLNRWLKGSKIAAKRLQSWEKSVVIHLSDVGTLSFGFRKNRFQMLKKPPEAADVEFSTDLQTYVRLTHVVINWKDAVKSGQLTVKRGDAADFEILERIWSWRWDE